MTCPICRKTVVDGSPEFPFCSDRCRIVDLGNWAMEKYVVPVPVQPGQESPEQESDVEPT